MSDASNPEDVQIETGFEDYDAAKAFVDSRGVTPAIVRTTNGNTYTFT